MVIAWLVVGVGLLLFELHHQAFYALFGAVGALAAAVVAAFLPDAILFQSVVAVVLTVVGVVAVRPFVSRVFEHHHGGHVALGRARRARRPGGAHARRRSATTTPSVTSGSPASAGWRSAAAPIDSRGHAGAGHGACAARP